MVGDPRLSGLPFGSIIDMVAYVRSSDLHGATFEALWNQEQFRCAGSFEADRVYTFYGIQYRGVISSLHHLCVLENTVTICRPTLTADSYRSVKEVCAGLGGISIGLQHLGGRNLAVLDINPVVCSVLRANFDTVLEGDITDRQEILAHVLQTTWHLQACCLVLECSPDIALSPQAMQSITQLAEKANFELHCVALELADQWASHRCSWWAVLLPAGLPPLQLCSWPVLRPALTVQDVIPEWPVWPKATETALQWDSKEIEIIGEPKPDLEPLLLAATDPAPTALHSWGSAFRPCPCGCRPSALSQHSLCKSHFRGPGVPSGVVEGIRYLHPAEALWVWAHVLSSTAPCFGAGPLDPLAELGKFKTLLLQQRQDNWLLPTMCNEGQLLLQDEQGQRLERAVGPITAGQLICAETALLPPGFKVQVLDNGRVLQRSAKLAFQPAGPSYYLLVQKKAAALDQQSLPCMPSCNATPRGGCSASVALSPPASCDPPETQTPLSTPLDALCSVGASDFTIWYGILQWIRCPAVSIESCLIPPCAAELLLQLLSEDLLTSVAGPILPQGPLILVPFVSQGHWSLLALRAGPAGVEAELWDGIPSRNLHTAKLIAQVLCRLDGAALLSLTERSHWLQLDPAACGAHVVAHAAALLIQAAPHELLGWALDFQRAFPPHLAFLQGLGGLTPEQEKDLRLLLVERGVPADAVASRTQALKACASKPSCMFRWILAEELQSHVEQQAQKKFGSFTTASDSPLGQLAFNEAKNLSVDPLALVTTAEISADQVGAARVKSIRYPAIFAPTEEAVLVAGSLIQLGDDDVQLATAGIAELDRIDTIVCRLNLFKDESTLAWDKVAEAPIRVLLQQIPALRVCVDPSCSQACGCFHSAVDEVVEHLFLDIWARQWCRLGGARVKATEADVFQAYVPVPASAVTHLLKLVHTGLYFEPRACDGTGPHPAWSVVWLPGASLATAQHALRTTEKALALARLGTKYGLRTREADEQQVFELHRPQHQFLKVRVSAHYRLHPLPHGLQRPALVQLLKQWGWNGEPLQPDRGDSIGAAWLVGASCEPPAPALPLGTDFVLISKLRDIGASGKSAPLPVYASSRTKKALLLDDDEPSVDPWSCGPDPWTLAKPPANSTAAPSASTSTASTKLEQIKADLRQDLQQLVSDQLDAKQANDPPPGLSEHDHRFHQLEVGLSEVRHQNVKFESWFQSFGTKVSDQAQQIQTLAGTVKEQHQELTEVRTDVQSSIKSAVVALQTDLSAQMSAQLTGQLEQIQSMLADKKPRLFETGRIVLARHYLEAVMFQVATLYGYPSGPTWPDARHRTDDMLQCLTQELVLGSRGLRVITGDFNHDFGCLDQCAIWRSHGWIELQCLAESHWGMTPRPTCKHATRRDYIWLSPEVMMRHDGLCTEVKRWFQQLRRLQSLTHALKAAKSEPAAVDYRLALWRSICRARGFCGGFSAWWAKRPTRLVGSPTMLPQTVPDSGTATCLFEDFRCNYRRLEAWHLQRRGQILSCKYDKSLSQLYCELREPAPEQVDTLTASRDYAILAVSDKQVHLSSSLDLRGSSTWAVDGQPVEICEVDDVVCTLSVPACPGQELEQTQTLSSVPDIHAEFVSLWASRWQQHATLTAPEWQRFLAFAAAFLPRQVFSLPRISVEDRLRAVKRFRPRAARGPDGWAKADLLNMPPPRTQQLLDFLAKLEAGECSWPQQLVVGFICLLSKQNGRADAHGYRPICLYSIISRAWAGLRARQVLQALKHCVPDGLHGFVPGREATSLWYGIQAEIELCAQGDAPLLGLSTDIIKCFNNLPRLPLLAVAAQLGTPWQVLHPWTAFLTQTERRFLVRGQVSEPLKSTSGFPEGCPLSPLAMLLADVAYHAYMQAFVPEVRSLSYVDNLATLASTPAQLARSYQVTQSFMDLLKLSLDVAKTYTWATAPADRRVLPALGLPVSDSARELGGFLAFGPRVHNAELQLRCTALQPVWAALRRSRAPLGLKLSVLPKKCWARALHGIAGCPLGQAHLQSLRTSATSALQIRPGGSSSLLRLSIAHGVVLWLPNAAYDGRSLHGPFTKLLQVLSQVGWAVLVPPLVMDHEGLQHDVLKAPALLLRRRLEHAWLRFVAFAHKHRATMHDLDGIDPSLLQADVGGLSALDTARYAAVRSGAFLFDHVQSRFDFTKTGDCDLCDLGVALACGPVPGVLQTAPRAEAWAMIAAAKWAISVAKPCLIWSDCLNVVDGVQAIQNGRAYAG
ncbi:unnamed protein product [Symbiodinium sp. CCMP2592]|nr:unnamed protein product [Symbiodinium sp. CCMP2592]